MFVNNGSQPIVLNSPSVARTLARSRKPLENAAFSPNEVDVEAENNIDKDSIGDNISNINQQNEEVAAGLSPTDITGIYYHFIK